MSYQLLPIAVNHLHQRFMINSQRQEGSEPFQGMDGLLTDNEFFAEWIQPWAAINLQRFTLVERHSINFEGTDSWSHSFCCWIRLVQNKPKNEDPHDGWHYKLWCSVLYLGKPLLTERFP